MNTIPESLFSQQASNDPSPLSTKELIAARREFRYFWNASRGRDPRKDCTKTWERTFAEKSEGRTNVSKR